MVPIDIELFPTAVRFLPGHRIMVQVQSSWFPLYDRNPQTFVPSIFWAKPEDFRKAVDEKTRAKERFEQALAEGIDSRVFVIEAEFLAPETGPSEHIYVLSAIGRDRVGLVARVSRFCCDRGVNILDLTSHAEDDQYTSCTDEYPTIVQSGRVRRG